MYAEIFKLKIVKARHDTGFTQREVAEETGIAASKIAKIETGFQQPDLDTLGKLADFYQVSLDWLLGTKGNKNTNLGLDEINREKNQNDTDIKKIV